MDTQAMVDKFVSYAASALTSIQYSHDHYARTDELAARVRDRHRAESYTWLHAAVEVQGFIPGTEAARDEFSRLNSLAKAKADNWDRIVSNLRAAE